MNSDQSSRGLHEPTITYYEVNANRFFWNTHNVDISSLYEPFLTWLPPRARILDAGCGSGRDSLAFLKRGYEVTALDASASMAKLASQLIGRPVLHMSFEQMQFRERFDGVWACASLLHIPKHGLPNVLGRLAVALKSGGVMYASFKYGEGEALKGGRLFNDYNEESVKDLLQGHSEFRILEVWRTTDVRPNCDGVTWLNVLLRKC